MSKSHKPKKDKVPKITEEEYAAYLSSLREPVTPSVRENECNAYESTRMPQVKTE